MWDDIILFEAPIGDPLPTLLEKSKINITNLYAGVSALFDIHKNDEELSEDDRSIFAKAMKILHEKMDGDALYDVMGEEAATYNINAESMLLYAQKIIEFNT
jgi:hypothetical protein